MKESNIPLPGADEARARVKAIVESFPEGIAELANGVHLKLQVRGKKFGWFMEDHHGDGRLAINCKAVPGLSHSLAEAVPTVFHIPKYVGHKGWIGIWVDVPEVDWEEVEDLLKEAYSLSAPKALLKKS
jgi:hypothetical protein